MFVRAHDIHTKEYYKSMVYALLDTGYFQQAALFCAGPASGRVGTARPAV